MFKARSGILGLVFTFVCASVHSAEWIPSAHNVGRVYIDSYGYYVATESGAGWGPASCPAVLYLTIVRSEPHSRELLSIVLFAKANNRTLWASGACHATYPESYFVTNFIRVD
jgi:hypothetical protein